MLGGMLGTNCGPIVRVSAGKIASGAQYFLLFSDAGCLRVFFEQCVGYSQTGEKS